MPRYINVDATINGRYPKTKAALKQAVQDDPESVWLHGNSDFAPIDITAANIPEGLVLQAVGPNPYTDRRWYASLTRGKHGRTVVK